jgi:hypothetical protein
LPGQDAFSTDLPDNTNNLVAGFGQTNSFVGYAKQQLLNGYPGVYSYLGQYFDHASQMDNNGNVTTNSAGTISPYGVFVPTAVGPVALVTMTNWGENVHGTGVVQVVKLVLDVNHDGTMDLTFDGPDNTSPNTPYVFWANNNFDRWAYDVNDSTSYMDDVFIGSNPGTSVPEPDCNYSNQLANGYSYRAIPCTRDLQDFTRLWVCGITTNLLNNLPYGSVVTLSWGDVGNPNSGNPTIDLFTAADTDGGLGFQTNETVATTQINAVQSPYLGRLGPGQSIPLSSFDTNGNPTWLGNYFIWCGVSNGTGGLTLTVADGNGYVLAQTTTYIQIMDIKQMYERWTVGESSQMPPMSAAILAPDYPTNSMTASFQYLQPPNTNTPYILFVHGWNLASWEKDRFAESAFKRLYWQGYQGRFGSFRWPTDNGFYGLWQIIATNRNEKDNFDSSEYQAWQSAQGLLNKLNNLNSEYPGHVYMLAHSMGNVLANEALRLAGNKQVVNTYVASQAAVTAHTYDTNVPNYSFVYYAYGAPLSLSPDTPNIYGNWFAGNGGAAGAIVNFCNTNDYALSRSVWQLNELLKPDRSVLEGTDIWTYGYNGTVNDPPPWNNFYKQDTNSTTYDFNIFTSLNNHYEVMAFDAQPYTTALGATPVVRNVTRNVSLMGIWPSDPSGKNYSQHFWHSAEFEGDYPQQQGYWSELLGYAAFDLK